MFLAFFVFGWAGDPTLSDLLQTWQDQDDPGSAILLAIKQAGATPLRSETHALFLAQSWHGLEPTLLADFNLWGAPYGQTTVEGAVLFRLGNSDWYAWLEPLPNDARIEYVLQYGEEIQLDPHNPISVTRPIGSYSVLEMPGYAFDPIASGLETGISKGLIQFEWSSPSLRNRRWAMAPEDSA